ncbi:triose-phosphate isomerase [Clostridium argentinense CDC 2741]|uniref:Triosephosphate isomerase n=1 Tax=Clostridium argentinense CDC 2741 TaxID=1418104 RepID=A0A0C1U0L4_9CLOT|nr:triose-phosphate isomerase [Clostridium argentinense]ARC85739.1 triose-phosphate isomerase [Clostridium argentinense]KIE46354.1 triose-phosphate isomerase [Clostridium argentinense CDC 2741]NFF39818.1 triose-phosphate isomerase [Clostridium argentinense]NFP51079.1 triose-phosphate isomerase [Clostridium argentinense]NFP73211.1 triose-phosphate isomerase [Clostridium argentinense]
MRKAIIAGNWKMHKTVSEATALVEELKPLVKGAACDVVVCPTSICLPAVVEAVKGTNIKVGAQNMHFEESGAFTGEISPIMLKDLGVEYVIIGHSERRQYFNETDETVNKKLKSAFAHGLIPILCIGESLEEREGNITEEVLAKQVKLDLNGITSENVKGMIVAYEPIWAIGTGKTATADDANETIGFIRKVIEKLYGNEVSEAVRIQYGGSVKPSTIKEQMEKEHIDGGLIGGASLKAQDFSAIVNY